MPPRRFTPGEEDRLRQEYETDWDEAWEIADRWGMSLFALRNLAGSRGWRRPPQGFKFRDDEHRERIRSLWEGGIGTDEIARFMGVTPDNARKICARFFGKRNLYLNRHTYMVKRNRQIHRMAYMGASREELAKAFRLSLSSINLIIQKLDGPNAKKHMGKFWAARKVKPFAEVRVRYLQKYWDEDYEQHEAFLREMVLRASTYFNVPAHMILSDVRGQRPYSRARQVVAYVLHTECGMSQKRIAEVMGRDRSTMSYTMRREEDRRDDPNWDDELQRLADSFVEHLRKDLEFTSPYELYFPVRHETGGLA